MKTLLFILSCFIAVTALISGLLLISNPDGEILHLPLSLLQGTPFKNYLVPAIILTLIVGGINLAAVILNLRGNPGRFNWAMAGGFVVCGWIIIQMMLIHAAHWLHFIYLGIGLLIILIAYQLKGKWAV